MRGSKYLYGKERGVKVATYEGKSVFTWKGGGVKGQVPLIHILTVMSHCPDKRKR